MSKPNWKVVNREPNISGTIVSGKTLNLWIKEMRQNPRAIGELGYCPSYVDESAVYEFIE